MATTVEKIYKLDIQGADSVNELKTAIEELNDKLKTLNATSQEYKDTLAELTEYQSKLADAMKGISDSSQTTNDSLNTIKDTVDSVAESISTLGDDALNAFAEGLGQGMAEAAQEVLQLGDSMENGVNSVKDLKQHISDLRDTLVTLDKGSDDYKATVQELVDAQVKLKEVMNAGKNEVQAAEGSYNALSQRMSALKQVWKEATDEATRDEIGRQIAEINAQLKGMDASIGNFQRNVGNYKSALDGLDGSFVNLRTQLKECKEAMQQLDPASQAYADAMTRASEITHQLSEQQEQIKYASTDLGDQLENVRGIATNLAAGYSAVNAAMGLFGEENEEVQQAMLKVQQAMALVQGLQGIDGFIKRTKGLSQSMGLVTKATQANTVATKANAAASKADAVAKGAEAVATKAAVPAQLSLNAAMKANPIGFIIGLIASLVTAFMLLKDKIMEMIGANEEMSAAFDKVKAVLAGFGNVIKKSIINPIKLALIPLKTLGKVMIDVFNRDWSAIGDDFKAGMEEMKDVTLDTINVVGAFKEGYDKKTAEQAEAARKKEAEARAKELDDIIKDNEAKYKSDWKYTEEGEKTYREYFKKLMEMYDENTEEYKQAQRDQWAYERELLEKKTSAEEEATKKEQEEQARRAKAAADAEKQRLNSFKSAFEKYIDFNTKIKMSEKDLNNTWEEGSNLYRQHLIDDYEFTLTEADEIIEKIGNEKTKEFWDEVVKGEKLALDKLLYDIDRSTRGTLEYLQTTLNAKKIKVGFEFPDEELNNIYAIMDLKIATFGSKLGEVNETINKIMAKYIEMNNIDLSNLEGEELANKLKEIKEELEATSPEFKKLIDIQNETLNDFYEAQTDKFKQISDVYKRLLDEETKEMQKAEDERLRIYENDTRAIQEKAAIDTELWLGTTDAYVNNSIQQFTRGKQEIENYYNELIAFYQSMEAKYYEYAESEFLSFEEKERAKQEAMKYTTLVAQAQADKQHELDQNFKESIKQWKDQIKSLASSVSEAFGNMADYYTGLMDLEEMRIDQKLKNHEIDEEEAHRQYQLQEESFEKAKHFQAAQAMINGLSAAVGAYQSMASIPYVGPVLGALAAAAALAAAIVNVKKINETTMSNPYSSASSSDSGGGSTNFQLPDVMATEPDLRQNLTNQSDIDELNNDGSGGGRGRGEPIECYVVESSITAKQELARKRSEEVTF